MPQVFISHSWDDNDIARKIAEYIKRDGANIWIDYARIEGGDKLPKIISEALKWCDALLLIWSHAAAESYWVEEEWTNAHALRKRIMTGTKHLVIPTVVALLTNMNRNRFGVIR